MGSDSRPLVADELVAGRYRLKKRLAQGGSGEVFVAWDETSQRNVALKRMLPVAARNAALKLGFTREYYLLSQLRHPRIIEVYDYGHHEGVPYYSMELLDGQDLADQAPVPFQSACRYLRDVASSLALLHARRLLHRDLSPRNVRLTSAGQCKLIDFGNVVTFGVAPNISGTPPFVPPEAMRQAALDHRSDLYALGALGYFLLTRRYAYPARDLEALSALHSQPIETPRQLVDVPAALDELIMSLMSLDPSHRPASTAEVIERLSFIGELEPDGLPSVARSFIISPTLIGRSHQLAALEHQFKRALVGEGGATLILGDAGMGRTRLLSEAARVAQLRGLTTIEASARGERATESISAALVAALPRGASEQGLPSPRPRFAEAPLASAAPTGEARARLQAAMFDSICQSARVRPLLIAIDDVEQADDFTMALIAALAHEARRLPIVIVATLTTPSDERAFSSLAAFRKAATPLVLHPLDRAQSDMLMVSMFGDVPNLRLLNDWMFQEAHGNPAHTLELTQQLLDRGVVRYLEGTWSLPAELRTELMPVSINEALGQRYARLQPMARSIAELMSIRRGGLAPLLAAAAFQVDPHDVLMAFDELAREGIAELAGDEYVFAQRAMREVVRSKLTSERATMLHSALAAALLASDNLTNDVRLEAGWHLVHTQDELRGADLLATVGPTLVREGVNIASALPAIERALAVYERNERPLVQRLALRAELVLCGYLFDYRLGARYAEQTLALLFACAGFDLADRLRRYVPKPLAFGLAITWASLTRWFVPRRDRAPNLVRLLQYLARALFGSLGLRVTALDSVGARALAERLYAGGSRLLPAAVRLVHLAARAFALQTLGREAELHDAVTAALHLALKGRPWGMSEREYHELLTGLLLVDGINECYRLHSQAMARASSLDAMGTRLAAAGATRVRMFHYASRADREAVERERRELELLAIQGGTTWQVEWFAAPVEGLVAIVYGDVVATRRVLDRLDVLLGHVPTLEPQRDAVRMGYHYLRGECDRVVELAEPFLLRHAPRTVVGWGPAYAVIVIALAETGQTRRAVEISSAALATLSPRDHEYFAMYAPLTVAHAWALALHGERAAGTTLLLSTANRLADAGAHAAAAVVHSYRARLAARWEDRDALKEAANAMQVAALATDDAGLIAQAVRWQQAHETMLRRSMLPSAASSSALSLPEARTMPVAITSFLGRAQGKGRARRALELLAQTTGCAAAYLYEVREHRAVCVSALDDSEPPRLLEPAISQLLAERTAPDRLSVQLAANDNDPRSQLSGCEPTSYHLILLDTEPTPTVIALNADDDPMVSERDLIGVARRCLGL